MGRRQSRVSSLETFTFRCSSEVVARRFRDYCYKNGLVMGAALEKMVVGYLIAVGDIESEENIRVEEALTR